MKVYVVNHHPAPQNLKLSVRYFWIKRKPKAIRKPRKKNIPYVGEVNTIIVKYLKNICNIAGC